VYHIVLFVLALLAVAYFVGGKYGSTIQYKQVEKEIILDNLVSKVNELKGGLMSELKACESGGVSEDKALITFDPHPTNKKVQIPSLGNYQFKVSTVQFYYKKFYGKEITNKEAVLIALSDEKAGELASDVIFRDGSLNNWYNCTKAHGLQNKLDIINLLIK